MNIPYVFKKCTKCGEIKLATNEYFSKRKSGKYGLRSQCKICDKKYYENNKEHYKKYRENNKEHINERSKEWYENNKERGKERTKKWREDNKEYMKEYKKEYYENNKEHHKEWRKEYYKNNKEREKERNKKYRENNKEHIKEVNKECSKKYRENNKEHIKEYYKKYRKSEQGQVVAFNARCRRRTKEQNQGNGITKDQWRECMLYFDFRDAYTGEVLTEKNRSLDHINPLSQGGEHEIWNLVPMERSLNCSKQDKNLLEWYQNQPFYSEERLQKIYEWQEYAFNKYGK